MELAPEERRAPGQLCAPEPAWALEQAPGQLPLGVNQSRAAATGATAAAAADAAAVWERMAGPLRHLHSAVLRRGFGRPLLSDGGPEREGEPARAQWRWVGHQTGCDVHETRVHLCGRPECVCTATLGKRVGSRRVDDLYPSLASLLRFSRSL